MEAINFLLKPMLVGRPKRSPEEEANVFWAGVKIGKPDECWPWQRGHNLQGYGQFFFCGERTGTHRVAWTLANGPIPDGKCCLHYCDNPPCCNPRHLWIGTYTDNNRDTAAKGRYPKIRDNRVSLPYESVMEIRARYIWRKVTMKQLATEYGCSLTVVFKAIKGMFAYGRYALASSQQPTNQSHEKMDTDHGTDPPGQCPTNR